MSFACITLQQDTASEDAYWESTFTQNPKTVAKVEQLRLSDSPTEVEVGTYIEDIKSLSLKENTYRITATVWFKWQGNDTLDFNDNFTFYKGYTNKCTTIEDTVLENGKRYQAFHLDVTISKHFQTARFPLDSHQLHMYLEPDFAIDEVIFVNDQENSNYSDNLSISGYNITGYESGINYYEYNTDYGHDDYEYGRIVSEHLTVIELNRSSIGVYLKCFIALLGTTSWVFIVLYICTFHRVDPLGMIPAALFGTVTNIMVGANLLPDALDAGLLEFVNGWGIFTIIVVTIAVININRIRNKHEDREFAKFFGKSIFFCVLVVILFGHLIMPLMAYKF